jgi:biotin synthase
MNESPDYVRVSLAAAMTLGLMAGRFYRGARLYCVNILLTYQSGCSGSCSYCGLSRRREGDYEDKSFIRVDWPTYPSSLIKERTIKRRDSLYRVCISMITHKRAVKDTIQLLEEFRECNIPLSVLANPTILQQNKIKEIKEAGVEMMGIAVDCATEPLFERHRGGGVGGPHKWQKYWEAVKEAVDVFGEGNVGVHLIVGLGETEEEMAHTIQRVKNLGARTHLFAFYPEEGSALQKHPPCPFPQYRRVQLARYLIDKGLSSAEEMKFDEQGRILHFGNVAGISSIIESGAPFQTSGCPGGGMDGACNRPFGDGPPSAIKSYPFPLSKADIKRVQRQLKDYG